MNTELAERVTRTEAQIGFVNEKLSSINANIAAIQEQMQAINNAFNAFMRNRKTYFIIAAFFFFIGTIVNDMTLWHKIFGA